MARSLAPTEAKALHQRALVVDTAVTLLQPGPQFDAQLQDIRAGAIDCALVTVGSKEDARGTLENIASWYTLLQSRSSDLSLATTVDGIETAARQGKVAIVFHFQNTKGFEGDIRLVQIFRNLGVRVVGLTYNERNLVGDGATERTNSGLSDFGVELVKELNRVGMVVDISHVGERTSLEAIEASEAPVVATHSNARALCDHPRNLSDEVIKGIARTGGVVGVNVFPSFVRKESPNLEHVMDHVDYVVKMIGVDHVGFGLDLNTGGDLALFRAMKFKAEFYPEPPWIFPEGIRTIPDWPNLTAGLVRRRYSEEDVIKILGGNFLRVFRQVWK
jgi:membrane dipeptidase